MNARTPINAIADFESRTTEFCTISEHPVHPRIRLITLNRDALQGFLQDVAEISVQNLEYVPFMRFMLAKKLNDRMGGDFGALLGAIIRDRSSGGFQIGLDGLTENDQDFVKFGTAIAHLLGPSNHDAMSGKYYARFLVKDTDSSDSYLRQAYRLFTLHTDGTFVEEATDWLLMMKFAEENAVGGESRLMHLDDWAELEHFARHPLAREEISYKAPGSKNVEKPVSRPTFFHNEYGLVMSFIDQFAHPTTIEMAEYLHDLSKSMEESPATREVPLPKGNLVVLNNYFWLHGRAPFKKHPELHRELMRLRGLFVD